MKKLALISVSDKSKLTELADGLIQNGYELLATGNTAKIIRANGFDCTEVSEFTGFPEIFSGRVKTLQPSIFGGILMRRINYKDIDEAEKNNIRPIDVVCVNLYPFPEVIKRDDADLPTKIENIDIGGPSLIRAAAKNYKYVTVLTSPNQYEEYIENLHNETVDLTIRERFAGEAFAHTSYYDTVIANFFEDEFRHPKKYYRVNYPLKNELRYGENPHQSAGVYGDFEEYFEVLHGKELSYNNIIDLTAAVELAQDMGENSCAIIKHTNPCGAAIGKNIFEAYEKALACDPVSAFGGIIAFENTVDVMTAEKMNEIFSEIICAPDFTEDALKILKKKKNRRLLKVLQKINTPGTVSRNIPGGMVAQDKDLSKLHSKDLKVATEKEISDEELENLKFAWIVCKHTKSNAIVFVKEKAAIGVGAGQMSRIDSAKIASSKAIEHGHDLKGAVAASDAFFPFPDGVIQIAEQGITSIIQPGGSVRDEEVINAANEQNISMVFTGIRNFKH